MSFKFKNPFTDKEIKDLNKYKADANGAADKYEAAAEQQNVDEMKLAREDVEASVERFNALNLELIQKKLLQEEKPFLAAVTMLEYDIIRASFPQPTDTKPKATCNITDAKARIYLPDLEAASKKPLANNGQWVIRLNKYTKQIAARHAVDLEANMKEFLEFQKLDENGTPVVDKAGKPVFDLAPDMLSVTTIAKELQEVFDQIIFIPGEKNMEKNTISIRKKDARFFIKMSVKQGRAVSTVKALSEKEMVNLVTEVLHTCVIKGEYAIDYKAEKKK